MQDLNHWSSRHEEEQRVLGEVRMQAAQTLTADTEVFLCTVDALCRVGKLQTKSKRRMLIIDEAGTVPEFKIPLALSLGGVEAVVAVGDQNQLQPFTHTGVPNGFFHRLAKVSPLSMLEEQFRMHCDISGFVSSSFYNNKLFTNPAVSAARSAVPHAGIHWVDYPDANAECSKRGALCNHVELGMLWHFMKRVDAEFLSAGKSVMIITFYREQFHLLMGLAEQLKLVGTRVQGTKTERFFVHPGFRISTVDASQGSESDVIVLSCVRCNPRHEIGFLSRPNRVCVAFSRAREHLIVLGNSQTLTSGGGVWERLFSSSQRVLEVSNLFQPKVVQPCPFIQASPL
jgi:superfamily I DNA and/or RNA helicase